MKEIDGEAVRDAWATLYEAFGGDLTDQSATWTLGKCEEPPNSALKAVVREWLTGAFEAMEDASGKAWRKGPMLCGFPSEMIDAARAWPWAFTESERQVLEDLADKLGYDEGVYERGEL